MPAERIAENLAFINWTVLAGLAVGSFAAVVLGRLRTDATRGYLGFTAACSGLLAWLAVLSDNALPASGTAPLLNALTWDDVRRAALVVLTVLAIAYVVALARGRRAPAIGVGGLASGGVALAAGAMAWGVTGVGSLALFVQLSLLAGATGGVLAAMILGHWYLVTPKLGEMPLVLFSRLLTGIVAAQLLLFIVATGVGIGPSGSSGFGALTGTWALFVWLRLVVGIVFPLVVSWAAIQTARTRSMESATGLLYISVGTIASGTILASGLYFGAGLLV
ncbi:MAG: hypothetical protein V4515_12865 [Chloroflexota bacterium]